MKTTPKVATPEDMAPTSTDTSPASSSLGEKKVKRPSTKRSHSRLAQLRTIAQSRKAKNDKLFLRRQLQTNKFLKEVCSQLRHSNYLLRQQLRIQQGELRMMNLIADKLDRFAASVAG